MAQEGPQTLSRLIEIEESIDDARRAGDSAYSPLRHVAVLIAMMAEARALLAGRDNCPVAIAAAPVA